MTKQLVGKQVAWKKLSGKPGASLPYNHGFGSFQDAEVGKPMFISGDYGLTTTPIVSIEEDDKGITVQTHNSVYYVTSERY